MPNPDVEFFPIAAVTTSAGHVVDVSVRRLFGDRVEVFVAQHGDTYGIPFDVSGAERLADAVKQAVSTAREMTR